MKSFQFVDQLLNFPKTLPNGYFYPLKSDILKDIFEQLITEFKVLIGIFLLNSIQFIWFHLKI